MLPKNRLGLTVQEGEFIDVKNGVAHVLAAVERWEEAPALSSKYRQILIYGLEMPLKELQKKVLANRGFGAVEAEYKQRIGPEPLEQDAFDCVVDFNENTVVKPITTSQFLTLTDDGYYFVVYATPVLTERARNPILSDWRADGALPGDEEAWIREYVGRRPRLDAPWLMAEILELITGRQKEGLE